MRGPHCPGSTCITEDGTLSNGDPYVRVGDLHIIGRMRVPIKQGALYIRRMRILSVTGTL